ncbi:MarR family winged helix-turn-helix transcriptional regulator [Maribellus maritimus]|uniref:MarR family winged helix-turn-helix transcriptional regulator n=1 Tax=Maribellus maritimus TaxID=2870838 RepID=UPI001EEC8CC9|nr:MarR family transcriptional regulator [Maribellus maritimus]MCG6191152.1 MarR family transcriptional regulator [Maribellus maritimus]
MKQIESNSLGYLLSTCNNQLIKSLNRELVGAKLELTREQYIVLSILWEKDLVNQQFLADTLGKERYSITKLVDGLEKRKLVKRVPSENDRRAKLIIVTLKALEIRPLVSKVVDTTLHNAILNIPEKDIEITKSVLEKIIMNVSRFNEN